VKLSKEILLSIAAFFAGLIFGFIFPSLFDIEVQSEINLSDLLSIGATVVLGIYLGTTITSRQSSTRFEKEFLIDEARKIINYLDSDPAFRDTYEINHDSAKSGFKSLNISRLNFENLLSQSDYSSDIETDQLEKIFREFRAKVLFITPILGIIKPDTAERKAIVELNSNFRKEVFRLIIEINRRSS